MKRELLFKITTLLTAILSLFGFTACPFGGMYGCYEADYYAEGYVLDEEDKPIEGVTVEFGGSYLSSKDDSTFTYFYPILRTVTDSRGYYKSGMTYLGNYEEEYMIATDSSGVYESDTTRDLRYDHVKKGDGKWYDGMFKISHTFHLKKRNKNN